MVRSLRAGDDGVATFCRQLTDALVESTDTRVVGTYLHGSAALGGWLSSRSDVDVLVVVEDALTPAQLSAVEQVLVDKATTCPGTGLECSVVTATQARSPRPPWPYLLHVRSSTDQPTKVVLGATMEGDPDLLMHYAVCRSAGMAVIGPEPQALIGVVPRARVLAYLVGELDWGLEHGTEAYAVLNACRALAYATRGEILSKVEGGSRAIREGLGPTELVVRALAEQQGTIPPRAAGADAVAFVRRSVDQLRDSARQERLR